MSFGKLQRPKFLKGIKGKSSWVGVTNIVSGASTVIVSASNISSGMGNIVNLGNTSVGSHRDMVLSVQSVSERVSFMIVADKATVDTQQVVYTLIRT